MKSATACEVEFRLLVDPCPFECHPCNIIGTGDTFEAAAVDAVTKLDVHTVQRMGLRSYTFSNIHATRVHTLETEQGDVYDVPVGIVFRSRIPSELSREGRLKLFTEAGASVPDVANRLSFFRRRRREQQINKRNAERAAAAEKAKPFLQRIKTKLSNLRKART